MAVRLALADLGATGERDLGASEWHELAREQVERFAEAVGSPHAQAFLILSLLPRLLREVLTVEDLALGVNYGADGVRFGTAVAAGARVRLHARLLAAEPTRGGRLGRVAVRVEVEGREEPALVGEVLSLLFGAADAQRPGPPET